MYMQVVAQTVISGSLAKCEMNVPLTWIYWGNDLSAYGKVRANTSIKEWEKICHCVCLPSQFQ